jgi:hypothetical protein
MTPKTERLTVATGRVGPSLPTAPRRDTLRRVREEGVGAETVDSVDLSGKEIDEKDAAQIVSRYKDARKGRVVLDTNADEVEDLARKGQRQARRGRRPKAETP